MFDTPVQQNPISLEIYIKWVNMGEERYVRYIVKVTTELQKLEIIEQYFRTGIDG